MSTFVVKKHIPLDFLGEGWADAYVNFSPFSFSDNTALTKFRGEVKKLQDNESANDKELETFTNKMLQIVLDKFIDGQGYDGEKLVPITKENFNDLPMEVFTHIIEKLQGEQITPKS